MSERNKKIYYIRKDGRWISVFITSKRCLGKKARNQFGDVIGDIYNIRRVLSHKRLRLCWRNLREKRVNRSTYYEMPVTEMALFRGPFDVDWKY